MTFDYNPTNNDLEKIKLFLIQLPDILNHLNHPDSSNLLSVCGQCFDEDFSKRFIKFKDETFDKYGVFITRLNREFAFENLFDETLYYNQLKSVGLTNSSLDFKMSFLSIVIKKWQNITNGIYDVTNAIHSSITKELLDILNIILNSLLSVAGLSKVLEAVIEFKDFTMATITHINNNQKQ